jgi:16S rRNA (cytidine1402-2'-O)-methyltransferase
MPGVSDPGGRMVRACREAGIPVRVVPGPCSVSAALAWSGMGEGGYVFGGFLPVKRGARARRLAALAETGMPLVVFESPYRLVRLLGESRDGLGEREVFVAREMTKRFEEGLWGRPSEILERLGERTVKGEVTVVVSSDRSSSSSSSTPSPV